MKRAIYLFLIIRFMQLLSQKKQTKLVVNGKGRLVKMEVAEGKEYYYH